jgi:hypothetical protein
MSGSALQRPGDLEDERQRRNVLSALDFSHMRALDASQVRQRLLRDALVGSLFAHRRTECHGWLGLVGGRANRPASLY